MDNQQLPPGRPSKLRRFPRASTLAAALALSVPLAGCQGERLQSSLHPASPAAAAVAQLWWVLLAILGAYSVAVFILMLVAIFRHPTEDRPPPYGGRAFILVGGVILPGMILVGLLIYSLSTTAALRRPETGLTIRVVGHRWWWEVEYPGQSIVTANEIYIPSGEPVRLDLTSADVIHSFWVPRLHGKMDLLPGQETTFWIEASEPGVYRGQCAEFCGLQHAHMAFTVQALPPEQFADWVANQRQPAVPRGPDPQPAEQETSSGQESAEQESAEQVLPDHLQAGRQAFFRHGCAACHAIRGTRAVGQAGPDLTYIGSRPTLGAATLSNTTENLVSWVTDPQPLKPGVNMPPTHASAEDIEAIVGYLQSLTYQGDRP